MQSFFRDTSGGVATSPGVSDGSPVEGVDVLALVFWYRSRTPM